MIDMLPHGPQLIENIVEGWALIGVRVPAPFGQELEIAGSVDGERRAQMLKDNLVPKLRS